MKPKWTHPITSGSASSGGAYSGGVSSGGASSGGAYSGGAFSGGASSGGAGFWSRLGQRLWGVEREPHESPSHVTVWDARRELYRAVDLLDRHDPLWPSAQAIAATRAALPTKSAA